MRQQFATAVISSLIATAITSCSASTLNVTVDRYEGELILSSPGRRDRIQSLVHSSRLALASRVSSTLDLLLTYQKERAALSTDSQVPDADQQYVADAIRQAAAILYSDWPENPGTRADQRDTVEKYITFAETGALPILEADDKAVSGDDHKAVSGDDHKAVSGDDHKAVSGGLDSKRYRQAVGLTATPGDEDNIRSAVRERAAARADTSLGPVVQGYLASGTRLELLPSTLKTSTRVKATTQAEERFFSEFHLNVNKLLQQAGEADRKGETATGDPRNAIAYAEQLNAAARAIERLDDRLNAYLTARFNAELVDVPHPPDGWMLRYLISVLKYDDAAKNYDIYHTFEEHRSELRSAFNTHLAQSVGAFSKEGSHDLQTMRLAFAQQIYAIWRSFEDDYPRISGLANFEERQVANTSGSDKEPKTVRTSLVTAENDIAQEFKGQIKAALQADLAAASKPVQQKDLVTPALLQVSQTSTAVTSSKQDGATDPPNAKKTNTPEQTELSGRDMSGVLAHVLNSTQYALRRINEMEGPYISIQPASAYLALEEYGAAAQSQLRPGYSLGSDWKEATKVTVAADARSQYVVMRDHIGNWQVKAASNDPTELINAAYGGAMAAIDLATQSGNASQYLRNAYQQLAKQASAGIGTPLKMQDFVDLLENRFKTASDENTAQLKSLSAERDSKKSARDQAQADLKAAKAAADKATGDAVASAKQTEQDKQDFLDKATADLSAANAAVRKQLALMVELCRSHESDLALVQQSLTQSAPVAGSASAK